MPASGHPRGRPTAAGALIREPLHKPRVAATEAFRDEMPHLPTEATRRPWQAPRASGATPDRPRSWQLSPVPSGFGAMALICVVARLANRHELFAAPRRLASETIAPETRLMCDLFR